MRANPGDWERTHSEPRTLDSTVWTTSWDDTRRAEECFHAVGGRPIPHLQAAAPPCLQSVGGLATISPPDMVMLFDAARSPPLAPTTSSRLPDQYPRFLKGKQHRYRGRTKLYEEPMACVVSTGLQHLAPMLSLLNRRRSPDGSCAPSPAQLGDPGRGGGHQKSSTWHPPLARLRLHRRKDSQRFPRLEGRNLAPFPSRRLPQGPSGSRGARDDGSCLAIG